MVELRKKNVHLWRHVSVYYVILAFYFQHCHMCTTRIYRTPGQFFFGTVNQGIFKTCESLVSCTIRTWFYTNKYNVHLYHNSMTATSRLRELNKRCTIAHNIANLFCRYLIFYDQVRYTAWFFYVVIFFIFFIIEVISCSNISACLFLKIFFVLEYKCMHLF